MNSPATILNGLHGYFSESFDMALENPDIVEIVERFCHDQFSLMSMYCEKPEELPQGSSSSVKRIGSFVVKHSSELTLSDPDRIPENLYFQFLGLEALRNVLKPELFEIPQQLFVISGHRNDFLKVETFLEGFINLDDFMEDDSNPRGLREIAKNKSLLKLLELMNQNSLAKSILNDLVFPTSKSYNPSNILLSVKEPFGATGIIDQPGPNFRVNKLLRLISRLSQTNKYFKIGSFDLV